LLFADAHLERLFRTIVERAIAISKQFETTSKARERQQRANESLPLTAQADAAFLIKLAGIRLAGSQREQGGTYENQLKRTLDIMRKGFGVQKNVRDAA
jgi:DNA mismatch repair protein MSH6